MTQGSNAPMLGGKDRLVVGAVRHGDAVASLQRELRRGADGEERGGHRGPAVRVAAGGCDEVLGRAGVEARVDSETCGAAVARRHRRPGVGQAGFAGFTSPVGAGRARTVACSVGAAFGSGAGFDERSTVSRSGVRTGRAAAGARGADREESQEESAVGAHRCAISIPRERRSANRGRRSRDQKRRCPNQESRCPNQELRCRNQERPFGSESRSEDREGVTEFRAGRSARPRATIRRGNVAFEGTSATLAMAKASIAIVRAPLLAQLVRSRNQKALSRNETSPCRVEASRSRTRPRDHGPRRPRGRGDRA